MGETNTNFPPGCKRVIITDDYYPALSRDNVTLEVQPIQCITPTGIVVDGKETEYDLIVLGTGFRTLEFMYPIKISGLGGRSITDI